MKRHMMEKKRENKVQLEKNLGIILLFSLPNLRPINLCLYHTSYFYSDITEG